MTLDQAREQLARLVELHYPCEEVVDVFSAISEAITQQSFTEEDLRDTSEFIAVRDRYRNDFLKYKRLLGYGL